MDMMPVEWLAIIWCLEYTYHLLFKHLSTFISKVKFFMVISIVDRGTENRDGFAFIISVFAYSNVRISFRGQVEHAEVWMELPFKYDLFFYFI